MAAGVVGSNAQVLSANIAGYVVSTTITNNPGYQLYSVPLDSGSNTLKNLFPSAPAATEIIVWQNGAYNIATYNTALGGHWKTNGVNADLMQMPVGTGYFVQTLSPFTNTFSGSVDPYTGVSVTNTYAASTYVLIGSEIPYSDAVTNTATINLTGVAGNTTIYKWNNASQGFDIYTWTTPLGGHWKLNGVNAVPTLGVGEGFFFNPNATYNWVQKGP